MGKLPPSTLESIPGTRATHEQAYRKPFFVQMPDELERDGSFGQRAVLRQVPEGSFRSDELLSRSGDRPAGETRSDLRFHPGGPGCCRGDFLVSSGVSIHTTGQNHGNTRRAPGRRRFQHAVGRRDLRACKITSVVPVPKRSNSRHVERVFPAVVLRGDVLPDGA